MANPGTPAFYMPPAKDSERRRVADVIRGQRERSATTDTQIGVKNTVTWSLSEPIGKGETTGDTWYRKDTSNQIIGIRQWLGDEWVPQTITDDAVSNLSGDKITAGTLDASLVAIRSALDGGRVEIDGLGFRGYNEDGIQKTSVGTDGTLTAVEATVTGIFRTAASGNRIELFADNTSSAGRLAFFDGFRSTPAAIFTSSSAFDSVIGMDAGVAGSPNQMTLAVSRNVDSNLPRIDLRSPTFISGTLELGASVKFDAGALSAGVAGVDRSFMALAGGLTPVTGTTDRSEIAPVPRVGTTVYRTELGYQETYYGVGAGKSVAGWYPTLGTVPHFGSASIRNGAYPALTQGDRCFRTDTLQEETYFAAYNGTTNPAGRGVAGWYLSAGKRVVKLLKSGTQPVGTTNTLATWSSMPITFDPGNGAGAMWTSGASTRLYLRAIGLWKITAVTYGSGLDNALLRSSIYLNGVNQPESSNNIYGTPGVTDPSVQPSTVIEVTNTTSYVELGVSSNISTGSLVGANSYFLIEHLG